MSFELMCILGAVGTLAALVVAIKIVKKAIKAALFLGAVAALGYFFRSDALWLAGFFF